MPAKIEKSRSGSPSLVKRGVALVILAAVGLLVVNAIVGFLHVLFLVVVIAVAVIAVGWAANQLL